MEIPMHSMHMDPDFYPEAAKFNPFRFATNPPKQTVTLDNNFLAFGYARNGCPGRFFAAHLMKVMMAYIFENYEIEFMDERPKMKNLMEFRIPNEKMEIKVRRRGD